MRAIYQILVEFELREGLPKAIEIKVVKWNYSQTLDNVNILFHYS